MTGMLFSVLIYIGSQWLQWKKKKQNTLLCGKAHNPGVAKHYIVCLVECWEILNSFLSSYYEIWIFADIHLDLEGLGSSWVPIKEYSFNYLLSCCYAPAMYQILDTGYSELNTTGSCSLWEVPEEMWPLPSTSQYAQHWNYFIFSMF